MAMYSIRDLGRREILMMSAALAGSGVVLSPKLTAAEAALQRTPDQILGPFYPLSELPQISDLTRVSGRSGRAEGQVLNVMGRVLNLAGEPVRNAKIEVWQANSFGRYTHPSDPNPAPLDPNFDGSANLIRPAHIHFQVSGRQDRLVTQMYFDGDAYNATDPFLNSAGRKDLLIAKLQDASPEFEAGSKTAVFDMVIYKG